MLTNFDVECRAHNFKILHSPHGFSEFLVIDYNRFKGFLQGGLLSSEFESKVMIYAAHSFNVVAEFFMAFVYLVMNLRNLLIKPVLQDTLRPNFITFVIQSLQTLFV
jgi:hypothetical protein